MLAVKLRVFTGDEMGAPRLKQDELMERFRTRFQELVPADRLDSLAKETGVGIRTLQRWWSEGVSQPPLEQLAKVAAAIGVSDPRQYFYSATKTPKIPSIQEPTAPQPPACLSAPQWMHQALDDAYASPYSDFVHLIVTWAARNQPRTGS